MAHPEQFERPTPKFVVWCSIQLSYGCVGWHLATPETHCKGKTGRPSRLISRRVRAKSLMGSGGM